KPVLCLVPQAGLLLHHLRHAEPNRDDGTPGGAPSREAFPTECRSAARLNPVVGLSLRSHDHSLSEARLAARWNARGSVVVSVACCGGPGGAAWAGNRALASRRPAKPRSVLSPQARGRGAAPRGVGCADRPPERS